jgi:poly(A) polymerase
MAIDLDNPSEIIDPLHGVQDLSKKFLRPCKESSFRDDPLRVIRAIRYSVKYNLCIETSTVELLMAVVDDLSLVSKERKRDELFKILKIENPWNAFDLIKQYKILKAVSLENLPDLHRAIFRLKIFNKMLAVLSEKGTGEKNEVLINKYLSSINSEIRKLINDRLNQVNQSERSVQSLDGLITLLWDLDEIEGLKISEALALSREEQEQIRVSLRNKCSILDEFSSQKKPNRKFIYRYYHALSTVGLDVALLTLTEAFIDQSSELNKDHWLELVHFCQELFEAWFLNPDYVNPKLFLTGRDLMFEFDIPQGPRIGQLLEGLREEQAIGTIQNRTQALAWVDGQLQKNFLAG